MSKKSEETSIKELEEKERKIRELFKADLKIIDGSAGLA
jgi:hypothetical protein